MFTNYVEFQSTGGTNGSPHPIGQFRLAAAVVDQLHFENARRDRDGLARLAVGLPDLVDGNRNTLARIRVYGFADAEASLAHFAETFRAPDASSVTAPRAVPQIHGIVAYVRDRTADREFNGYSERALSRAQRKVMERLSRGESVRKAPLDSAARGERLAERQIASTSATRAHLRLASRSTGHAFALFVAPVACPNGAPDGRLDVYGLSTRSSMVALPAF